ncbi:MAG TPA: hypothetical protein VHI72_00940 [Hyphomicrobiaceae bacterium]|jgi:hypothetical protein|nr:hypothetical protein [Hyphomicrobiaceae bacterium]
MAMHASPGLAAILLKRILPLALILALAVAHGAILSPLYDFVSYFVSAFTRRTMFYNALVLENFPSLLIAVLTLLLGGIPAAIYERIRGLGQSTTTSMLIWLATTILVTAPVLTRALGLR